MSVNKALNKLGKVAVKSLCKELLQIHDKVEWRPVALRSLSWQDQKRIIRSSMFFKEKYLSTGEFEKLKARLVAGGNMQDRSVYSQEDTEAPTVALQSVYTVAAIAAHEGRVVVTADITGAYLNADMKKKVYMRLEPKLAEAMAALEPSSSSSSTRMGAWCSCKMPGTGVFLTRRWMECSVLFVYMLMILCLLVPT